MSFFLAPQAAPDRAMPPQSKISVAANGPFFFARDWNNLSEAGQLFFTAVHSTNPATHGQATGVQNLQNTATTNNGRTSFEQLVPQATDFTLDIDFGCPGGNTNGDGVRLYFCAPVGATGIGGANDAVNALACDLAIGGGIFFRSLQFVAGVPTVFLSNSGAVVPNETGHFKVIKSGSNFTVTVSGAVLFGSQLHVYSRPAFAAGGAFGFASFSNPLSNGSTWFDNLTITYTI